MESARARGWVCLRTDVLDGPGGLLDGSSDVISGPGCISGRDRLGAAIPDEEDRHQSVRKRVDRGEIGDPGEPRAIHPEHADGQCAIGVQRATDMSAGDDRAHRGRFPDHDHVVGGEEVGDGELHHRARLLDRRRAGHALKVTAGEDQIRQGNDHLSQTVTGPTAELRWAIDRSRLRERRGGRHADDQEDQNDEP